MGNGEGVAGERIGKLKLSELPPQRWKLVQEIAGQVLDAEPESREFVLNAACSGDTELREFAMEVVRQFSDTDNLLGFAPPLKAAEQMDGERIGPYRIVRELGHGGMGTVYLAARDDGAYEKLVAVKTIPRFGGQALFVRERQILAGLDHPGIARLLDGGTTGDGTPYLVMEYIDGVEITAYAEGREEGEILGLFLQVCAAMRYAHQRLVVHRDLKPANILVTAAGEAKVLDFGIAKMLEEGDGAGATHAVMTPAWASPEQLTGGVVSTLSDVYSLGLILYRLLAGKLPKAGTAPGLPRDLQSIVLKALENDQGRRYSSVEQLAADVERYRAGMPVEARQGTWAYRAAKFVRRRKGAVAAGVAFVVVIAAGAWGTLGQKLRAERRADDVSGLARAVMFSYQDDLAKLGGSTALRAKMARDAVEYLDRVARDASGNAAVLRETALAYRKVGEVQGYSRVANLGDHTAGVSSFRKSEAMLMELSGRDAQDEGLRVELGVTLERLGNALSNSGRNREAREVLGRAIRTLESVGPERGRQAMAAAWRELSSVEERRGQNKMGIEAARKSADLARGLPRDFREDKAWALGRLAMAITLGERINEEATATVLEALALYGKDGAVCGEEVECRLSYLSTLEVLGRMHYFADRDAECMAVYREIEETSRELAERDPHNRMPLRQLRIAQGQQALLHQSMGRGKESLVKYKESVETAVRITEADPTNTEGVCATIYGRAKVGEVLIQNFGRAAEAEKELREALRLSDSVASDNLSCLDQRKLTVLNLGRVAEKKGDAEGGMEWRRETVRVARRIAGLTPGEPLGMLIEAGANYELGLGGLKAGGREHLEEARRGLIRALEIYKELAKMGNPLEYQYSGWPAKAAGVLEKVERELGR